MKNYYFFIVFLACVLLSCKEKKQPPVDVVETVAPDTTFREAPVVRKEVVEEPVYFLIAGCFETPELAERLQKKLTRGGYDSRILPYFTNLHLVSYSGYPDLQSAKEAHAELVREAGKEKTWIYKLSD
ncbi:MAG: hypothetical protein LBR65_07040 [Culturomica sp.]|jgi:cell division protein FtsN|nr:hypothetical protein [Culturomica sp.]